MMTKVHLHPLLDDQTLGKSSWPTATVVILSALLLVCVAYWETIGSMVAVWGRTESYRYGYLVVPISLCLVWKQRDRLASLVPKANLWGLGIVLACSVLWACAHVVDVQIIKHLSFVCLVAALIFTILGPGVTKALAFPLGYLLLAVPVWSLLVPTLQDNTAMMTAWVLRHLGIPVLLDGYYLSIPAGNFVVADVCSGLRYLLVALAISTLYAYLNYQTLWRRIVLILTAVLVGIVCNWVRVVVIVLVGHVTAMQHPLVSSHNWLGNVLFGLALVLLFFFGGWLREAPESGAQQPETEEGSFSRGCRQRHVIVVGVAAIALAALGPVSSYWGQHRNLREYGVSSSPLTAAGSWSLLATPRSDWHPRFVGADVEVLNTYQSGARRVQLYLAYYPYQKQGAEVINDNNSLYDEASWTLVASRDAHVSNDAMGLFRVHETEVRAARGGSRLLWHWYHVAGRQTASRTFAKLLQLWGLVTQRPGAAVIAVAVDNANSITEGRLVLEDFMQDMMPRIEARLGHASVVPSNDVGIRRQVD